MRCDLKYLVWYSRYASGVRVVVQLGKLLLHMLKRPRFDPQNIKKKNQTWWYIHPVIWAPMRWTQEDQKFKFIPTSKAILRIVPNTQYLVCITLAIEPSLKWNMKTGYREEECFKQQLLAPCYFWRVWYILAMRPVWQHWNEWEAEWQTRHVKVRVGKGF